MKYLSVIAVLLIGAVLLASARVDDDGRETSCPCPRIYDPVCGSDNHTYSNKCMFNCQARSSKARDLKLRILRYGPCEGDGDLYEK